MTNDEPKAIDLVWGIGEIAKLIGRTHAATYHMCATGELPVKRVGRRWVAKRQALIDFFDETAA